MLAWAWGVPHSLTAVAALAAVSIVKEVDCGTKGYMRTRDFNVRGCAQRGTRASRAMEYNWAGRGPLPPSIASGSALAAAFGPEEEEGGAGDDGAAAALARIQVGDALVALLERHRSYR